MIKPKQILLFIAFCVLINAKVYHLVSKSTRQLTLATSAHARLFRLRGGAKRKNKRVEVDSESEIEDENQGYGHMEPKYMPKKKGLVASLFTLLFRLVLSLVGPFLPKGLLAKATMKKSSVQLAGRVPKGAHLKREEAAKGKVTSSDKKRGTVMTQEHLEKALTKGDSSNRVQKELRAFLANPPENCKLSVGANIRVWVVQITGAEGTVFAGEKYKLKIVFPKEYPAKPPSVFFLKPTPRHVHVYSNGDICLNLLGKDWRPTMSAQLLVVSIYSMLGSAKQKGMPQDNAMHADNPPGQQQEGWMYHDDRC